MGASAEPEDMREGALQGVAACFVIRPAGVAKELGGLSTEGLLSKVGTKGAIKRGLGESCGHQPVFSVNAVPWEGGGLPKHTYLRIVIQKR